MIRSTPLTPLTLWYGVGRTPDEELAERQERERTRREMEEQRKRREQETDPSKPPTTPSEPTGAASARFAHAVVVGRFDPLHRGHEFLVDTARGLAKSVDVVVRVQPNDAVPGSARLAWCRDLYGSDRVHALEIEPPTASANEPAFWSHWATAIRARVPHAEVLVTSDREAWRLADAMGVAFVLVDPSRLAVPISATEIRKDPIAAWAYLSPPARAYYARRVCLIGPEASGKTTLATALAARLGTVCVPEQARVAATRRHGELRAVDVPALFATQTACEDALARHADRVLVCDTDLRSLVAWSERLFGECPPALVARAEARPAPALYVLPEPLAIDGSVSPERIRFAARCAELARASGARCIEVRGDVETRIAQVLEALALPG